jgi:RNA polymerase sigma-70 factor, ECF subfamily
MDAPAGTDPPGDVGEVTRLLVEMQAGNRAAEGRLLEVVYPELKRIAQRHLKTERAGHTLQPTALVNEAYLQLVGQIATKDWQNRQHFYAVAAQLMRRILVDYARSRRAAKRDGGRVRVDLTDILVISEDRLDEVLALDEALARLAVVDGRKARVVEMRFFGGLTEHDIAGVLGIDPRTVKRDWQFARAWLYGEMNRPTLGLT